MDFYGQQKRTWRFIKQQSLQMGELVRSYRHQKGNVDKLSDKYVQEVKGPDMAPNSKCRN